MLWLLTFRREDSLSLMLQRNVNNNIDLENYSTTLFVTSVYRKQWESITIVKSCSFFREGISIYPFIYSRARFSTFYILFTYRIFYPCILEHIIVMEKKEGKTLKNDCNKKCWKMLFIWSARAPLVRANEKYRLWIICVNSFFYVENNIFMLKKLHSVRKIAQDLTVARLNSTLSAVFRVIRNNSGVLHPHIFAVRVLIQLLPRVSRIVSFCEARWGGLLVHVPTYKRGNVRVLWEAVMLSREMREKLR